MTVYDEARKAAENVARLLNTPVLRGVEIGDIVGGEVTRAVWASLSSGERNLINVAGTIADLHCAEYVDETLQAQIGQELVTLGAYLIGSNAHA